MDIKRLWAFLKVNRDQVTEIERGDRRQYRNIYSFAWLWNEKHGANIAPSAS